MSVDDQTLSKWYINESLKDPLMLQSHALIKKRICIMGACGQMGSHIVTKLYELGLPSSSLMLNDCLSLGSASNLPRILRESVNSQSHKQYVETTEHTPDILLFLGGRSSASHFSSVQDVIEEIVSWGSILEWCSSHNIRLVLASTSSLCKARPSLENEPVWPGSLYELAKLTMENMAIEYSLTRNLKVQICRLFSVYGITEKHKGKLGNLYTQLLWHAKDDTNFEVWGRKGEFEPGEQTRDTIFATEAARAVLHLLTIPTPQPSIGDISSVIYNIGQGRPVALNEMVKQVSNLLGKEIKISYKEVPEDYKNYVVHTWGSPAKLLETGFQPIFINHTQNLRFINYSLDNIDEYWSTVEKIRANALTQH